VYALRIKIYTAASHPVFDQSLALVQAALVAPTHHYCLATQTYSCLLFTLALRHHGLEPVCCVVAASLLVISSWLRELSLLIFEQTSLFYQPLQALYAKLRHFLREIWRYAQRHPYKVFFAVIMPLVSSGVLVKLAKQFGVNLPDMSGGAGARGGHSAGAHGSSGYYGSAGYGDEYGGRGGGGGGGFDMQSLAGGISTAQSLAGGVSSLASLASMASKFM
jgi:hypothetical protein